VTDDRLIEPFNRFEGERFEFGPAVLTKPRVWRWVINPWKPSWGEPYTSVANRMLEAIEDAWTAADGGEVVMVSHQMPIVMVQRSVAGEKLFHDPRKRRCSLSSITTLQKQGDRFVEVGYQDLAAELLANSIDTGAV
jgi:broad specificity phosphatase PhoE